MSWMNIHTSNKVRDFIERIIILWIIYWFTIYVVNVYVYNVYLIKFVYMWNRFIVNDIDLVI